MSWGKFQWLKELKSNPKYAEVIERFHDEIILKGEKARERGYAIVEAKTQ
ncbi:MAG: hypothetical protein QXG39_04185 [Candidatus Aenigmatarchaeota archaeon]